LEGLHRNTVWGGALKPGLPKLQGLFLLRSSPRMNLQGWNNREAPWAKIASAIDWDRRHRDCGGMD